MCIVRVVIDKSSKLEQNEGDLYIHLRSSPNHRHQRTAGWKTIETQVLYIPNAGLYFVPQSQYAKNKS